MCIRDSPYYERFLDACPTVRDLAALPEEKLLKLWEGLGYYSRARNLHKAARVVCEQYDGQFPADYAALRALPVLDVYKRQLCHRFKVEHHNTITSSVIVARKDGGCLANWCEKK